MIDFLGKQLQSPIIIGSGPLSYSGKAMKKLMDAGAGAVATKTIRKNKAHNPAPHMAKNTSNSLINNEQWSDFSPEQWIKEEIPFCKQQNVPCIASVGHTLEESQDLVEAIEQAGADFIELVSYDKNDLEPMIKDAKKRVKIPVIAKLPPMIDQIGAFAKTLQEAGADAITACDSVGPALRIDIKTAKPYLGADGIGYLSGEVIKGITLHKIYEIKKQIDIPIIGLGGAVSGADALEMVMAGASFVGICSIVILKGTAVIQKISNDLYTHLKEAGYSSIDQACFAIQKHMNQTVEHSFEFVYDEKKCLSCAQCAKVCAYTARTFDDTMHFNEKECRYCGLCTSVCPNESLQKKHRDLALHT